MSFEVAVELTGLAQVANETHPSVASATISVIDLSISLPLQFILIVGRHICSGGDVTAVTKKMIHAGRSAGATYFLRLLNVCSWNG